MNLKPTLAALFCTLAWSGAAHATLVADYRFANTFASSTGTAPDLIPVNPTGLSGFGTDTVFGVPNTTIYSFKGNTAFAQEGGLTFNNGLGTLPSNSYSIDMIFKLTDRDNAYRRLVDVQNRISDNGLYIRETNNLTVFPVSGSASPFTPNTYFDVVLTVASDNTVIGYLNGVQQFTLKTPIMNIDNPANVVNFFLDDAAYPGEWSGGSIARLSLYNAPLTASQIRTNFDAPLPPVVVPPGPVSVPEPMSTGLLAGALLAFGLVRRARS